MSNPTTTRRPSQQAHAPAAPPISLEPGVLDETLRVTCERLQLRATRYSEGLDNPALSRLGKAMLMAQAVDDLHQAIDGSMMERIMSLMNRKIGFRTDRGPGMKNGTPYSTDKVKEIIVEALLAGVYPVGNEFNIIADGLYITREGYERKLRELPGMSELDIIGGVPAPHNGRVVVRMGIKWKINGVPGELTDVEGKPGRVYAIIAHESTSPDAIVGKGARKALRDSYKLLTGRILDEEDDSPAAGTSAAAAALASASKPSRVEQLEARLGQPAAASNGPIITRDGEIIGNSEDVGERLDELTKDLEDRLLNARTDKDRNTVWREVVRHEHELGPERHERLTDAYRASQRAPVA